MGDDDGIITMAYSLLPIFEYSVAIFISVPIFFIIKDEIYRGLSCAF